MKLNRIGVIGIIILTAFPVLGQAENVAGTLNELIETSKDGQNGFLTAADAVQNQELKELFRSYADQRGKFVNELQNEVRKFGEKPETTGTAGAKVHRGWINIKSAVTQGDERAIIAEAEKGEAVAVETYGDALQKNLPDDVRDVVAKQAEKIRESHEVMKKLEDSTKQGMEIDEALKSAKGNLVQKIMQ